MDKTVQINGLDFALSGGGVSKAELVALPTADSQIQTLRLSLAWAQACVPEPFTITWEFECPDVYSSWIPRAMAVPPMWGGVTVNARLAADSPVLVLTAKSGQNRCVLALSDPKTPTQVKCEAAFKTFLRRAIVTLFTEKTGPFSTYEVLIRIDRTPLPFSQAIQATRAWYDTLGYHSVTAPEAAFDPVYSTWYSYVQNVTQTDVPNECRLAAKLGMKTVILDDGWQKNDHPSLYGFTGDWKPYLPKFPDMAALVDEVHALGMRFMLWFAVPFVGEFAENYARFAGKYLNYVKGSDCSVLDPRFPEVRRFIIDTYVEAMQKWHLDGFKLDFIDRFKTNGEVTPEMDFVSVEEATNVLLIDVMKALTAVKPDILLEFRQPYAGIVTQGFGNMFRVWDCPNDGFTNHVQTLNLRLLNGGGAVHSDMIDISVNETVDSFAAQLIGVTFSVPQISFRLANLSPAHSTALQQFLTFWSAHRETLMHGELSVQNPELDFAYVSAAAADENIILNQSGQAVYAETGKTTYCFNQSAQTALPVVLSAAARVTVVDCLGKTLSDRTLQPGVHMVDVPFNARLQIQ